MLIKLEEFSPTSICMAMAITVDAGKKVDPWLLTLTLVGKGWTYDIGQSKLVFYIILVILEYNLTEAPAILYNDDHTHPPASLGSINQNRKGHTFIHLKDNLNGGV
jgi:hypothetical protein